MNSSSSSSRTAAVVLPYTSHRCVETPYLGKVERWVSRTCVYDNLYYHPATETFYYYSQFVDDTADATKHDKEEDAISTGSGYMMAGGNPRAGPFNQFRPIVVRHDRTDDDDASSRDARPFVINNASRVAKVQTPSDPIFVLYKPSYDFNFGHFVFDDVLSVFTMLDFFGFHRGGRGGGGRCDGGPHSHSDPYHDSYQPIIPVHLEQNQLRENADPYYRCGNNPIGRWPKCSKMLKRVMAGLLGISPDVRQQSNDTTAKATAFDIPRTGNLFGRDPNSFLVQLPEHTDLVILPKVIAGPGRLASAACAGECTVHRASQMLRFRTWMFRNVFEGERVEGTLKSSRSSGADETVGKITVSLPVGNTHGPENVCSFERIVPALKDRFGARRIAAVDMATLTLQEQASLVASSTLYITNQGGGGASSLFLRRGSSVVLFYPGPQNTLMPLDHGLYGTAGGYLNVLWVKKTKYCIEDDNNNDNNNSTTTTSNFVELVEDILASNEIQQQQRQQ